MRSRHRRLLASPLLALALLGAGCSDDQETSDPAHADHVEVEELGAAFTFDDFAVAEGWQMRGVERSAGLEATTSPEVRGEVTNEGEETRFALFEIVFASEGDVVARLKCSSPELEPGETGELLCPGLGQPVPEDYDQIVVQDLSRDGETAGT